MNVVAAPPVVRNVGGETKIFAEGFHFVSNRGRLSLFQVSVDGVRSKLVGEGFENTRDWLVGPDGTPLAQALRVLAAEMRQDRMLRIEEKAIRLPALLVIPLILFIMPAVFIALVGPSVLELGKGVLSGTQ